MIFHRALFALSFSASFLPNGIKAQSSDNSVTFGVFDDQACTIASVEGRVPTRETGPDECITFDYDSPTGGVQTNSEHHFLCCKNFVVFVQYPGQDSCEVNEDTKRITYNVMTTECDPVQTHFGQTYQKLIGYDTPCAQTTDVYYGEDAMYAGYGDTLTAELCNDETFVPEGGAWAVERTQQGGGVNAQVNQTSSAGGATGKKEEETGSAGHTRVIGFAAALSLLLSIILRL